MDVLEVGSPSFQKHTLPSCVAQSDVGASRDEMSVELVLNVIYPCLVWDSCEVGRYVWYPKGLIGAEIFTVYYEVMSLDFRKGIQEIAEYAGMKPFLTTAVMDQVNRAASNSF